MERTKPGDIEIIKIYLYSLDGNREYDLRQQCKSINIYESILSPIIYGEIVILDSNDLLRQFPLIGEEYIDIEFQTPGSISSNSYRFHVKSITGLEITEQQKSKSYVLNLVSQELLENAKTRVDYKLDQEINKSIGFIIKNYLNSSKRFESESTRGIDKVLISKMSPFVAIDKLRRRAVSKKYYSSSFVFFENKRGFNFFTLEKMFEEGRKIIGDKIFYFDSNVNQDVSQMTFRNIISYNQVSFADTIEKVKQGGLNNKVYSLDFVTGKIKELNYTNNLGQDLFKFADDKNIDQNTSNFQKKYGKTTNKIMFVPYDSSRDESFIPEKVSILQSYTQKIIQNLIHIYTYGDNEITVGDVIECNFPEAVDTTGTPNIDRLSSGNFLVSKLRHIIIINAKPLYTQSYELIKGSMFDNT